MCAVLANGYRGKKLKLAARANVDNSSNICLKMAGQACKLIEIKEPFEVSIEIFDCGVDFFWNGLFMVNTLVLEPNAPSIDMVSHDGCVDTKLLLLLVEIRVEVVMAPVPGDLDAETCLAFPLDCLESVSAHWIASCEFAVVFEGSSCLPDTFSSIESKALIIQLRLGP